MLGFALLGWPALRGRSASNSLIVPCGFPGCVEKASVYAGPNKEFFLLGKNSLIDSLRRELCISMLDLFRKRDQLDVLNRAPEETAAEDLELID